MPEVDEELYFHIDEKNNSVELTEKGLHLITKSGEDPNFFLLPDISVALTQIDQNAALTAEQKAEQKDRCPANYKLGCSAQYCTCHVFHRDYECTTITHRRGVHDHSISTPTTVVPWFRHRSVP